MNFSYLSLQYVAIIEWGTQSLIAVFNLTSGRPALLLRPRVQLYSLSTHATSKTLYIRFRSARATYRTPYELHRPINNCPGHIFKSKFLYHKYLDLWRQVSSARPKIASATGKNMHCCCHVKNELISVR